MDLPCTTAGVAATIYNPPDCGSIGNGDASSSTQCKCDASQRGGGKKPLLPCPAYPINPTGCVCSDGASTATTGYTNVTVRNCFKTDSVSYMVAQYTNSYNSLQCTDKGCVLLHLGSISSCQLPDLPD